MPSWPAAANGSSNVSLSQLPVNVIAPPNGAGVPITVACGPPTSVVPFSGVATSAHVSAAVMLVSPDDVLTRALLFVPDAP